MPQDFEFDVALSFAGSDREIARVIGSIAKANGLRIFFDEFYVSELWGKNLVEYLGEIYSEKARFCLILISKEYCQRPYTNVERRRALDRAIESKIEFILPVVLDDSWLEGLPRSTAYLDLRKLTPTEVGEILVRKVKDAATDSKVLIPEEATVQKVILIATAQDSETLKKESPSARGGIVFADIRIAQECKTWKETKRQTEAANEVRGEATLGIYSQVFEDPTFDITIINRSGTPTLLTAVGVEILELDCEMLILGGASAEAVKLDRTYCLELPDMWAKLAELHRPLADQDRGPVIVNELAVCRLPDPIYLEENSPYRFGLNLFDYLNLMPNRVDLKFWLRTDLGESHSSQTHLSYLLGGDYGGYVRYSRLTESASEREGVLRAVSYQLWEKAGKPQGRDKEFWSLAQEQMQRRDNEALRWVMPKMRPL